MPKKSYGWSRFQIQNIGEYPWDKEPCKIISLDQYKRCSTLDLFGSMTRFGAGWMIDERYNVLYVYDRGRYFMIVHHSNVPTIDFNYDEAMTATTLKRKSLYWLLHERRVAKKFIWQDEIVFRLYWRPLPLRCQTWWERDSVTCSMDFGATDRFYLIGYCTCPTQYDVPRQSQLFLNQW